jgi:hypothetical protein
MIKANKRPSSVAALPIGDGAPGNCEQPGGKSGPIRLKGVAGAPGPFKGISRQVFGHSLVADAKETIVENGVSVHLIQMSKSLGIEAGGCGSSAGYDNVINGELSVHQISASHTSKYTLNERKYHRHNVGATHFIQPNSNQMLIPKYIAPLDNHRR